jgi:methanol---5-hydroxybenzimidazolylcobamide Co-methyltransferase
MNTYKELAYKNAAEMIFGKSLKPIQCRNGMVIGGGLVYPEINFTLPQMSIDVSTFDEVKNQYRQMITGVCQRALDLHAPGIVVEIELLPPMTINPSWGIEVTKIVKEIMTGFEANHGLKSLLRITPNDTREMNRPPVQRSGKYWDNMMLTFEECAKLGADFLAIESTGGKEICDDALISADISTVIFALGVLGARDMKFLWGNIVDIANKHHCYASGDTACGFGNTAMVLAEQGFIPKIFAAAVRLATVPRSLVAYEMGAVGPSKDCAYEGPYMKAIAGVPIAMEGKSSACAHLSPLGNIAGAVCDLWSNESVQNIKLLGGMAPTVSMEQLVYDIRLMNQATKQGSTAALQLRDLLVDSDSSFDPQAYVLRPDFVLEISKEFVKEADPYLRTKNGVLKGLQLLQIAVNEGKLQLSTREAPYLTRLTDQVANLPDAAEELWEELKSSIGTAKFLPQEYDWKD